MGQFIRISFVIFLYTKITKDFLLNCLIIVLLNNLQCMISSASIIQKFEIKRASFMLVKVNGVECRTKMPLRLVVAIKIS